ncbi:hypothetical protein LIER_34740 [Lithospermum erythrorhizon]|uniref:Uncharacterized protein n=1 Tax=Lithospermum erythrorhizon TaxID=34254 RepID=A0AAV3S3N0_LITER
MYPAVLKLQVHLQDYQNVCFKDDDDLESLMEVERSKRSTLIGFFHMNSTNTEAQKLNCLYKEFPIYYV